MNITGRLKFFGDVFIDIILKTCYNKYIGKKGSEGYDHIQARSQPRPALHAAPSRTEESEHTGRIGCKGSAYAPFVILMRVYA